MVKVEIVNNVKLEVVTVLGGKVRIWVTDFISRENHSRVSKLGEKGIQYLVLVRVKDHVIRLRE